MGVGDKLHRKMPPLHLRGLVTEYELWILCPLGELLLPQALPSLPQLTTHCPPSQTCSSAPVSLVLMRPAAPVLRLMPHHKDGHVATLGLLSGLSDWSIRWTGHSRWFLRILPWESGRWWYWGISLSFLLVPGLEGCESGTAYCPFPFPLFCPSEGMPWRKTGDGRQGRSWDGKLRSGPADVLWAPAPVHST